MRDASAAAPWRVPWCTTDLVQRLLAQNHLCNPLFSLPAFTIKMFKLDWLHIMDLGVSADVAGNVLWLLQGKMCGATVQAHVSQLYLELAKYYKETGVQDKLSTLIETKQLHSAKVDRWGSRVPLPDSLASASSEKILASRQCL